MSPDETPEETEPEKPRRRRRKASEDAPASESPRSEARRRRRPKRREGIQPLTRPPRPRPTGGEAAEIEPTAEDVEAEEAAADVMLEADDEAEGESELDSEDEVDEPEAEEAAAPASSRRRRRRGAAAEPRRRRRPRRPRPAGAAASVQPGPPPVVRAQAKYVRSSARKARLVCDHIRGKSVEEARAILAHTPRAVARDWSKLLESAVANAEHNHELVGEDLYVKAVHADEGPTIKRFRPRAMGRATRIRKRTSHLTILLTPKD